MNPAKKKRVVGITGGIASGKTTLARELEKRGAVRIDADAVGRDVVDRRPDVRSALRGVFGDSIFDADGTVDRGRLAERVFSDPGALRDLNRIVHPYLLAEIRSRIEAFRRADEGEILVVDAALLVEWGAESWVDVLVVVESDPERQVDRIRARDGWPREAAMRRIAAQADRAARARVADEIVTNDGEQADLAAKAEVLWRRLQDLPVAGRNETDD